jgi:hypothetical protein
MGAPGRTVVREVLILRAALEPLKQLAAMLHGVDDRCKEALEGIIR